MAWVFVRHTPPDVAPGTCYGRTDLELADSFVQDAAAVLDALPEVARVVSSPLTRCARLANYVAEARGVPLTITPDWTEMDFGAWEGQAWSDLPRAELDAWAADFMGYAGHGGESVAALHARVGTALKALKPGSLVVSHAGVFKSVAVHLGDASGWDAKLDFGATRLFEQAEGALPPR